MSKHETRVLVGDGARARVFRLDRRARLLAPAWEHHSVGTGLASRQIASDRPGRTFDRVGEGRHGKEPPTDPARYEKKRFAREVIRKLDAERRKRAFERLILVAPPQFLGDLRTAMPKELQDCLTAEINKDLTKLKPAEIFECLDEIGVTTATSPRSA